MVAPEEFHPPIEIGGYDRLPLTTFSSPSEIVDWLNIERDFWSNLANASGRALVNRDSGIAESYQLVTSRIDELQSAISGLLGNKSKREDFDQYIKGFASYFRAGTLFHSSSRFGYFVSDLKGRNAPHALRVAISLCGVPVDFDSLYGIDWAKAAAVAEMLEYNAIDQSPQQEKSAADILTRWERRFSNFREIQKKQINSQVESQRRLDEISAAFSERVATNSEMVGGLISDLTDQVKQAVDRGNADILAIKETFKADLALQAPTTYWKEKQVAHRKVACGWAVAFLLSAIASGVFIWKIWSVTVDLHLADAIAPSYGYFLPTAAAAFLAIWILRIISRQLLANLALGSDAGERVAMVKTFLALMQKPEHVKEPDRVLILSSLFRAATRSDDDAAPPNWFDLVMQRLK